MARDRAGGEGVLWRFLMLPLRAGLQLAGGSMALLGVLSLLAEPLNLRGEGLVLTWCCGFVVMLAAATKHAYPLPPIGAREAIARLNATLLLGGGIAALMLFLAPRLAIDLSDMQGALVVTVAGVVVALMGRYPRIIVEGPLVTADELAHADDVIAIGSGLLFASCIALMSDAARPLWTLLNVVRHADPLALGLLAALALGLPLVVAATFAFGRRGRSPIDRVTSWIALPVLAAALLAMALPLRRAAADAALTTLLHARARTLAGGWREAAALESTGLLVSAALALVMAFGAAWRARQYGRVHDPHDRRHLALVGGLSLTAALMVTLLAWRGGHGVYADVSSCFAGAVISAFGVMAVHFGSAGVGGAMNKLQSRAAGYVATAAIGALLASLLCAAALTTSLAGASDAWYLPALWWPSMLDEARARQTAMFLSAAVFVLPTLLTAGVVLRGRLRAALSAASRHFGWGLLWISLSLLLVALTAPVMRDDVTGVWRAAAPDDFELTPVSEGGDGCEGIDGSRVVFIDRDDVVQGGRRIAASQRLASAEGRGAVAAALARHDHELAIAVGEGIRFAHVQGLVNALARDGTVCSLRLVAGIADGAAPTCVTVDVAGADCRWRPNMRFVSLQPTQLEIDDSIAGRLARHNWPADRHAVGRWMLGDGVGIAIRGDVPMPDVLMLLFQFGAGDKREVAKGARLPAPRLLLPVVSRESGVAAAIPTQTTVATATRAFDDALGEELAGAVRSRSRALADCHRGDDGDASLEADYLVRVERDGHVGGVWRGRRSAPVSGAASCTALVLADAKLSSRASASLIQLTLSLTTRLPEVRLRTGEVPEEQAAGAFWSRELTPGALDVCYRRALVDDAGIHGTGQALLRRHVDGDAAPTGWYQGQALTVRVDLGAVAANHAADAEVLQRLGACLAESLGALPWPPELEAPQLDVQLAMMLPGAAPPTEGGVKNDDDATMPDAPPPDVGVREPPGSP